MNQQALDIYQRLSKQVEELEIYKEYLEHLYPNIVDESIHSHWNNFLDITNEILGILDQMGYTDIIKSINVIDDTITVQSFRNLIQSLYQITVSACNAYNENIRKCALCKEKVFYLPLPDEYYQMRKKYQVPAARPERLNEKEYICPVCGSLDRDRLIISYLNACEMLTKSNASLLQVAPTKTIEQFLKDKFPELRYDSVDLYMQGVTYQLDLQDMYLIKDNSYDMWICSHVLEHIPDDRRALYELYRILKPNGIGILLVPMDLDMVRTDEENGCSEEENWRRFGQGDHVRKYAKQDFMNRITECGFLLECLGKDHFGEQLFKENGLEDTATLYIVRKEG